MRRTNLRVHTHFASLENGLHFAWYPWTWHLPSMKTYFNFFFAHNMMSNMREHVKE